MDQPQTQPNQQNHERDLDQAAEQHERQEEEWEAVARAVPTHLSFKPIARAKPIVWAKPTARPGLILRADLTAWIELAWWRIWRFRRGLVRWRPIVALRPTKAPAVRLHPATERYK